MYIFLKEYISLTSEVLTKTWNTSVLERIRINAFCVELAGQSYQDLLALAAASVDCEAGVGKQFICFHRSIIMIVVSSHFLLLTLALAVYKESCT